MRIIEFIGLLIASTSSSSAAVRPQDMTVIENNFSFAFNPTLNFAFSLLDGGAATANWTRVFGSLQEVGTRLERIETAISRVEVGMRQLAKRQDILFELRDLKEFRAAIASPLESVKEWRAKLSDDNPANDANAHLEVSIAKDELRRSRLKFVDPLGPGSDSTTGPRLGSDGILTVLLGLGTEQILWELSSTSKSTRASAVESYLSYFDRMLSVADPLSVGSLELHFAGQYKYHRGRCPDYSSPRGNENHVKHFEVIWNNGDERVRGGRPREGDPQMMPQHRISYYVISLIGNLKNGYEASATTYQDDTRKDGWRTEGPAERDAKVEQVRLEVLRSYEGARTAYFEAVKNLFATRGILDRVRDARQKCHLLLESLKTPPAADRRQMTSN